MRAKTTLTRKPSLPILLGAALAILTMMPFASIPQASFATGNGAPSGPHYNLNIIGAKTTNCPQTDSSGGNVIFAALQGDSDIFLQEGTPFAVLDNNACNDGKALFQLPAPGTYTIWARVEGIPGGSGSLTTCATDPTTGETVCSTGNTLTIGTRDHGNKFQDVTNSLTQLCYFPTGSTTLTCVNIFDTTFQNFFWSYDNHGNKVLQLRFYPSG
jgi:hypothetical protein